MSSSKKIDVLRDFAAGVYLSEAQNPIPSPLDTLYTCTIQSTNSHREGGGGRVEPERRIEGQHLTKLGRKYQHDILYLQSVNSDI